MNSSISGQGGFSWFVFATFFHFSPTWMPCPKHFAISPRIYCSFYWFYWFYWVSRHLLDALAGSSCSVSLDFFSSVSCGFLSVFHLRYMPEQSHFHVVSWPTESRLYALEKHGKMKRHQMKPDLRPTINRQYGGVKLVNPYADQLPPILYLLHLNRLVSASLRSHLQTRRQYLYAIFPRTFWTTTFFSEFWKQEGTTCGIVISFRSALVYFRVP